MINKILVTGLSGSGKSHTARKLANELNIPYIESDDFGYRVGARWFYNESRLVGCLVRMDSYVLTFPSDCIYDDFPWDLFTQVLVVEADPGDIIERKSKRKRLEPQNQWIVVPSEREVKRAQRRMTSAVRRMCLRNDKFLTLMKNYGCGPTGRGERDVALSVELDLFADRARNEHVKHDSNTL